jgi:hypothetical protein
MKKNCLLKLFCFFAMGVSCFPFIIMKCAGQATGDTNGIPGTLLGYPINWSSPTNGVRVGVAGIAESNKCFVEVFLLSALASNSPPERYVAPPGRKFERVELLGLDGNAVHARQHGVALQAVMPPRIAIKDLPIVPQRGLLAGHGAIYKELLFFNRDGPDILGKFIVDDSYKIPVDGEYTLSIWPVIYKFGTNSGFVERVILPAVTARVHLLAELPPPPKSSLSVPIYTAGLLICLFGVGWLVFLRWRTKPLPGKFAMNDRFVNKRSRENENLFVARRIKAGDGSQS